MLLVIVLVLLNGFFVAAEFAVVKVRGSRLETLAAEGNRRAKFAQGIVNNLNAYLSACQLGITLTSLALGWVGEPAIYAVIEPLFPRSIPEPIISTISFVIAFFIMTLIHITIGEQVPKTYAIRQSERVTLWTAAPIVLFYKAMYPFIWMLNGLSNWMLRRAGIEPDADHESVHTEEEIRVLIHESHKSGLIDNTEMTFVDNIFEFSETHAREIMVPRTEMVCLYAQEPLADMIDLAMKEPHTRYPVCDPDKDNIIGYVHLKDLMKAEPDGGLRAVVRPLLSVPDSISISVLLKTMQKNRTELALLIDEYGGTSGLVTIEDILEEIVGEIHDEFDEARPSIEQRGESTYSVDGLLLIEDFNGQFGTDIPNDVYDTIGGWVYAQLESAPNVKQSISHEDFDIIIEEVDNRRVSRVLIQFREKQDVSLEDVS
ncbi:hemolysin family protein [Paenibacillus thermoaerophilus]|uniref:Hemolysin family protein n=1 Tax=Paenibacillus thermoaerophilus TaxID=1215385 RepID=A0ABW2UZ06_9BACL|nr:hemolysin family protein [Paenibacillus thermoaerophilus]